MSIVGRFSTHRFFPHKKICEVPVKAIQAALIMVFKLRGMPQWIKVDNGRPFGDPQLGIIPVLALWVIALGTGIIWNRRRTPQDNAKVERKQGVMSNWTEWGRCTDTVELQCRLWREADFNNLHYPVSRLKGKTRIEAFPGMLQSKRPYCPKQFDVQRAIDFLAQGHWKREVSKVGQIGFWGKRFSVGMKYRHQRVSVKLDPTTNHWQVFDASGNLIKERHTGITAEKLWNLDLS